MRCTFAALRCLAVAFSRILNSTASLEPKEPVSVIRHAVPQRSKFPIARCPCDPPISLCLLLNPVWGCLSVSQSDGAACSWWGGWTCPPMWERALGRLRGHHAWWRRLGGGHQRGTPSLQPGARQVPKPPQFDCRPPPAGAQSLKVDRPSAQEEGRTPMPRS